LLAGCHAAHKNQTVPLCTLLQLSATGPTDTIETSLFHRLQLLVQAPFTFRRGVLQCPEIGDVAQNWFQG
jgi:hypothetical protein